MNEKKPRLAEILGVEVGEKFRVSPCSCYFLIRPDGDPTSEKSGLEKVQELAWIIKAINHPESIIRAPRLTEPELTICKVVGAKWVSRNNEEVWARLWSTKPEFEEDGLHYRSNGAILLALANGIMFPSVHPGDLIEVP